MRVTFTRENAPAPVVIETGRNGSTPVVRYGYGEAAIDEPFTSTFARDVFVKGYVAHLAEDGWTAAYGYQPGDRVRTPHGQGTATQEPALMASGWTVRVDLDDTTATASGHARYRVDELSPAI
jgi:hypothetical protein